MARIPACGSDCPRRTLTARQCPPGYCAEAALGLAVQAPGGRLWRNHLTKRAIRGQTTSKNPSWASSLWISSQSDLLVRSMENVPVPVGWPWGPLMTTVRSSLKTPDFKNRRRSSQAGT